MNRGLLWFPAGRVLLSLTLACLVGACAHTPVRETLSFYRQDNIEDTQNVTFDGRHFHVPGYDDIPRDSVKAIQFRLPEKADGPAAEVVGATLSNLARELEPRGQAMAQTFPGVGGVILVDDGVFEKRPDGTHGYRYHFAGVVLKEEMKQWAQLTLGFTEGRSRVRVSYARSVNPDGTVTALAPDDMRIASPGEDAQFFNPNRKVLSGVIPGVQIGSVIEYVYEFDAYAPEDPRLFFPGYFFQGTEPVVFSRVEVIVPADVPFQYTTRNFEGLDAKPAIQVEGKTHRYTWIAEDMPPLSPEPMMPPQSDLVPYMVGSIFEDWEAVFALQRKLQEARIKLTPEIEAAVAEITAEAQTLEDKVAAIYHWVQTNTRYVSIKGSLGSGFSGHTAQETFENRYGDCTDKAILLATMCQAIGVTSYPIILKTNDAGTAVTEIPTLTGNHAINEVELGGRRFYLDSTSSDYRYPYFRMDDHGCAAFNAIRGDIRMIPVPPPEANQRVSKLTVSLRPNGDAVVRTANAYTGSIEAGIRGFWKQVREDNRPYLMADYVNSISPGAMLDDFTLSDIHNLGEQVTMSIDYTIPEHAIRSEDLMYLRTPTLDWQFPEASLETRRFPIQYMSSEERILEVDMLLPRGWRLKWAPPPMAVESPYLRYEASYEEQHGTVVFRQSYRRLKRIVPPEDYPAYRDALRRIAEFSTKEIFITAAK